VTPTVKALIDQALDAHDAAIATMRASAGNMDAAVAVALTTHTAALVKDIATTVHTAFEQSQAALHDVLRANRELLAALRAADEP